MGEGQPAADVEVFLQWKGTDACFDFYCECGQQSHFDGYFAYYVRCTACKTVWKMPSVLTPVTATPEELADQERHGGGGIQDLDPG